MDLSEEEVDAGVVALTRIEASGIFFGPTDEARVRAVIDAVVPLILERMEVSATEDALRMMTAIVMSQGGRVAVPASIYDAARAGELVRYDDPTTKSAVFETPLPEVA